MRKEIIKTLVDLCMEINGLSPRTAEEPGGLPTVFYSFSGHVGMFCIEVFLGGWKKEKLAADMKWELYTDGGNFNIERYENAYGSLLALRDSVREREVAGAYAGND